MRKIVGFFVLISLWLFSSVCFAEYPYESVCPKGYNPDGVTMNDAIPGGPVAEGEWYKVYDKKGKYLPSKSYWRDQWGFAQCNCTSYASYRLNDVAPLGFNNGYEGVGRWGHGKDWGGAAKRAHIQVDNNPLPGDVAYWDNKVGEFGHVAFVESVEYDEQGKATTVHVSEYNWPSESNNNKYFTYGERPVDATNPSGYIHFLSHGFNRTVCTPTADNGRDLCWSYSGDDVSCSNGYAHMIDDRNDGVCYFASIDNCFNTRGWIRIVVGGRGGGVPAILKGPGHAMIATDAAVPSLPDFVVKNIWLETPWGAKKYKYGQPETMKMKAQFKNIGKGYCSGDIEVHFYLSKGYKEDAHSEWKRVGTDIIQCDNMKPGDTHTETEGIELWRDIPEPGMWNIVACVDHIMDDHNSGGAHPEKHESNNCSSEAVFEVTADGQVVNISPKPDFIVSSLSLTNTPVPVPAGGLYGARMAIRNIGQGNSPSGIRSQYALKGPGTPNADWKEIDGDDSDADELTPGRDQWEEIGNLAKAPEVPGNYTLRACADEPGRVVAEENEDNNCAYLDFQIYVQPSIVVTNPIASDEWRSDKEKHIEWDVNNFPERGDVKIEYSMDGGASWRTIESSTSNDGGKYWKMCGYKTTDSNNSFIRITSIQYPNVFGVSQRFTIDHAKGCE
ncbi:MAG: CHAP domain-containing protein [Thermodesulfovibrionales bacterium]|jgi:surface antigen